MDDDPDIGSFLCIASLPQGRLSLARLFRHGKNGERAASTDPAVARGLAVWSAACGNGRGDGGDGATASGAAGRLVRAGGPSTNNNSSSSSSTSSMTIETFAFAHAGLAVRPRVCDLIQLCPILSNNNSAAAAIHDAPPPPSSPSTLARVVPYSLATRSAFVAIAGTIDGASDLERRFAAPPHGARRPASSSPSPSPSPSSFFFSTAGGGALRGAHSMPLPSSSSSSSFAAARDAALANEVACLSMTPPSSSSFSRARSAALSGVRRAVQAGEAAARAVLALVEDALGGPTARAADSPVEALTLALGELGGSFALVLHDAERGLTLAARDASGEEELWLRLAADGGSVAFASPRPVGLDLPGARAGDCWHPVPAGHFVVCGGPFGRQPRLHQYALAPEELSARASAAHGHEHAPRVRKGGVALQAAADAAAAAAHAARGAATPVSPHSSSLDDFAFYE